MSDQSTKEPQYNLVFDVIEKHGRANLGLLINESWQQDPKRSLFTLSRYKFAARMLEGKNKVLEIGCADAFGTRIVQQSVSSVTAIDFDPIFIRDAQERMGQQWQFNCKVHDILDGPVNDQGLFEAIYTLDVLEHIDKKDEDLFMKNSLLSLEDQGAMIIGMPSLESQIHASPQSKAGHVNCKSGEDLKAFAQKYFHNVFMFSMNDEAIHTGFFPMSHYLIAVCAGKIS